MPFNQAEVKDLAADLALIGVSGNCTHPRAMRQVSSAKGGDRCLVCYSSHEETDGFMLYSVLKP